MPAYRLPHPDEQVVFAVDFRPGSTVVSRVECDIVISEVTHNTGMEQTTTTVILPIDVAISLIESLQLPELARWTHAATTEL